MREFLKIIWPFFLAIITATVFIISSLNSKAPAETVHTLTQDIYELKTKVDGQEKRSKWLTQTVFDIAKKVGMNPEPPP